MSNSDSLGQLGVLRKAEKGCTRCPLRADCTQVVPGIGPAPTAMMFVGEAPGGEEDNQGEPFVGPSGQLLNTMLQSAKIDRETVFVTNVCRCRPPKNRTPEATEILACKSWLWKEIQIVRPKVIVTLGAVASRLLLKEGVNFRITKEVGKARKAPYIGDDVVIVPMFHPSYLLQHGKDQVKGMVKVLIKIKRHVDEVCGVGPGDDGAQAGAGTPDS